MALLQTFLTLLTRWAGRILNTVFSWATEMVFGKVPESRQIFLSVIAFGSVAWMIAVLGIIFPGIATFLLTFVPVEGITAARVRIVMVIAAVLLPLLIGIVSLYLHDPEGRPEMWSAKLKYAFTGYPYTIGLALTFLMMLVFAPVLKVRTMLRRWSTQHVPMVVEAEDYQGMVKEIKRVLHEGGWPVEPTEPSWMLKLPTQVLATLTGGAIEQLVASQLTTLQGDSLAVVLHPSDLVISGETQDVTRARTIIVQQLAFTDAHMTWTQEGNELEERLDALWRSSRTHAHDGTLPPNALAELSAFEETLKRVEVPYEEWEILFREKLLVERGMLRVLAGLEEEPEEPVEEVADSQES